MPKQVDSYRFISRATARIMKAWVNREPSREISTITLSPMPDVTASVTAPRIAAIEYPLGRYLGQPGDITGQTAVLRATFLALHEIKEPGSVAKAISRRPWLYRNFLNGNIPD